MKRSLVFVAAAGMGSPETRSRLPAPGSLRTILLSGNDALAIVMFPCGPSGDATPRSPTLVIAAVFATPVCSVVSETGQIAAWPFDRQAPMARKLAGNQQTSIIAFEHRT